MTRVSFSDNVIGVNLPKVWQDLSQEELAKVYEYMARYEDEDVRFHLIRYFANITLDHKTKPNEGKFKCYVTVMVDVKPQKFVVYLTPAMFACWAEELNWLADPGDVPVRLEQQFGVSAVNAQFHGVPFSTYLKVENLYQGYLQSKNPAAIQKIESLLYPGSKVLDVPGNARIWNILHWIEPVKRVFSRNFPHFFRPAGGEGSTPPNMLEIMNNQIRALTGGDITKEEEIYKIDCWRALTELDYKAKEAEEFKRLQAKYKQ